MLEFHNRLSDIAEILTQIISFLIIVLVAWVDRESFFR